MREQAFEEELQRWRDDGQFTFDAPQATIGIAREDEITEGCVAIDSSISGNVWKIEVQEGQVISKGQTLMVLESMKMEIAIQAQFSGKIEKLWVRTGQDVQAGQCLMWLEQETET